jgi:anti-sigma B factor antagonist
MMSADSSFRHPRAAPPSGRTIVRLRGALDIDAAPALRERLIGVLHRGTGLLILDLSHVLSCDASGLAVLIGTQRRARLLGIMVRLAAPSLPVTKVLRSTGLDRSFTIYPDLSGALASELDKPHKASSGPASPRPRLGDAAPSFRGSLSASELRQRGFPWRRVSSHSLSSCRNAWA